MRSRLGFYASLTHRTLVYKPSTFHPLRLSRVSLFLLLVFDVLKRQYNEFFDHYAEHDSSEQGTRIRSFSSSGADPMRQFSRALKPTRRQFSSTRPAGMIDPILTCRPAAKASQLVSSPTSPFERKRPHRLSRTSILLSSTYSPTYCVPRNTF